MDDPFEPSPSIVARSPDGAEIAAFAAQAAVATLVPPGSGPTADRSGPPLLLVHGTGSDHTTWRVFGPLVAASRPAWAMDRRGRGASSEGGAYAAGREVEDVVAMAEALATRHRQPVAVLGHSLGGRIALAATLGTTAIDRVIAYESAPGPPGDAGTRDDERLLADLRDDLAAGDPAAALARFLTVAAGLAAAELEAFRASPLWAVRVATAPRIVRELDAALHDPAIGFEALAAAPVPVLQLTGTVSPPGFRDGARALDARLANGRIDSVRGAGHAAHHAHAAALLAAVVPFLDR